MLKKWFCLLLCTLLMLTGCVQKKDYEEIEISYEELVEKINNKETFVVEVYRENCPFCEKVTNYVEETKQEHPNVVLYRLDCTDWELKTNEEGDMLLADSEIGQEFLKAYPGFYYTPTFYAFKEGKVLSAAVGFSELNAAVSIWNVETVIDFNQADMQDFWEFIETYQKKG
ncbi:MAG: thioredoxin family protein [Bacillota bacterium]|nr:thioredoxin family protein [Bacillota bacterium]